MFFSWRLLVQTVRTLCCSTHDAIPCNVECPVYAFYYVRILQIPTPRHSLYDAVALNRPHPDDKPATIQERAYSSPIWYTP